MTRKRNKFGQYLPKDYNLSISFPRPLKIIKYLLIALIVAHWLFILEYRLNLKEIVQKAMESIFLIKNEDIKKSNGFF